MEVKGFLPVIYFFLGLSLVIAITGYAMEGQTVSSVEIEGLRILADTFNGSTTTFSGLSTEELNNMSNLTLEKSNYGKIIFNESINLTQVAGVDRTVNFDRDLNISDNLINADSNELPYINKSATIYLYNLTFTTPQIISGSGVCSTCTLISYSGGTLIFSVTSFSGAYYARETPVSLCGNGICNPGETTVTCPSDCPAGGTGGGGGGGATTSNISTDADFYVEPIFFTVEMNRGEYFQKKINVINNGTENLKIYILVQGLDEFIFPQTNYIELSPGQNYSLRLDIYVSMSRPVDVYVGKILFKAEGVSRDAKAILDIGDRYALFDIRTEILKKYVTPGGRVRANISIINMGSLRNFDVSLEYMIVDFDNNNYTIKKEEFAMNQSYFNILYLDIPKDIPLGNYVFYARVNYGDIGASSFDTFTVEVISWIAWVAVIASVLVIIFIIFRRLTRDKRLQRRVLKEQLKEKPKIVKEPLIRRIIKVPKIKEI